jgi:hypothetical protein
MQQVSSRTGQSVGAGPAAPDRFQRDLTSSAPHVAILSAAMCELRAELEQLRTERNRLAETQRRIMELLQVQSADKLVHDIRNVLNERDLLRALTADM